MHDVAYQLQSRHILRLRRAATFALTLGFVLPLGMEARCAAQTGLLLGLRKLTMQQGGSDGYRTLWIAPQGERIRVEELPDLIVPRKTGFWRVGTRYFCDADEIEREPEQAPSPSGAMFAAPVGQRPMLSGVVQCPRHEHVDTDEICGENTPLGSRGVDIWFVNEDFIAKDDWSRGDCGAHPDGSDTWSVVGFDDAAKTALAYSNFGGGGSEEGYARRAAQALISNVSDTAYPKAKLGDGDSDEDKQIRSSYPNWATMSEVEKVMALHGIDDGCFPAHDDTEWYIARGGGRWAAYGDFDTHRLCGVSVDFELPFHPNFDQAETARMTMQELNSRVMVKGVSDLKAVEGVYDAMWSPASGMVVVLVGTDTPCTKLGDTGCLPMHDHLEPRLHEVLQVYLLHGRELGRPILSMSLREDERVVMCEWAAGKSVERWNRELRSIRAQGRVTPIVPPVPAIHGHRDLP